MARRGASAAAQRRCTRCSSATASTVSYATLRRLRDGQARVAEEADDGARGRRPAGAGGAGRLRQDGGDARPGDRAASAPSGCSSSRCRSAGTCSCGRRFVRLTTSAVCEGLDRAFRFFGAMPRTIIPDNMSAIVAVPDALAPRLTESFSDYAQARGIFVDPARVRKPKDKARVENQVPYVREELVRRRGVHGTRRHALEGAPRCGAAMWPARACTGRRAGCLAGALRRGREGVRCSHHPSDVYDVPDLDDCQGAPRSSHPDRQGALLGAFHLPRSTRARSRGSLARPDLRTGTALSQDASAPAAWRPLRRSLRLPRWQECLCASQRRCPVEGGAREWRSHW